MIGDELPGALEVDAGDEPATAEADFPGGVTP